MADGRPTKYRGEYCQQLIKYMATGMPYETFAAEIGVDRDTLYEWEKKYKAFSDAKKIAKEQQYKQLASIGMAGMTGRMTVEQEEVVTTMMTDSKGRKKGSNTISKKKSVNGFHGTAWIFWMKNCAGWKNEQDFNENDLVDSMDFDSYDEEEK